MRSSTLRRRVSLGTSLFVPRLSKPCILGLATLAALGLVAARPAQAQSVKPGDTFSFDISGFNSAGTVGYLLPSALTASFGATTTFTGAGINGQDITVTSSETTSGLTTTDIFTVSTPVSFLTTSAVNGTTISQMQFDLGNANSGSNTVDLTAPMNTSYTATGNILYGASNTSFTLTPATTLSNNNSSYSGVEGVSYGTNAISSLAIHSFTYSIAHSAAPPAVPEASTTVSLGLLLALGMGGLVIASKRKKASVQA